jgi:hypothetical protein
LQFDKDVRKIVSFFTDSSKRSIRELFLRLTQIGAVLQLESVSEMLDYWTDSEVWVLSADEVKQVMHCRVDFSHEMISGLHL